MATRHDYDCPALQAWDIEGACNCSQRGLRAPASERNWLVTRTYTSRQTCRVIARSKAEAIERAVNGDFDSDGYDDEELDAMKPRYRAILNRSND